MNPRTTNANVRITFCGSFRQPSLDRFDCADFFVRKQNEQRLVDVGVPRRLFVARTEVAYKQLDTVGRTVNSLCCIKLVHKLKRIVEFFNRDVRGHNQDMNGPVERFRRPHPHFLKAARVGCAPYGNRLQTIFLKQSTHQRSYSRVRFSRKVP